jgi:hypothetical protein
MPCVPWYLHRKNKYNCDLKEASGRGLVWRFWVLVLVPGSTGAVFLHCATASDAYGTSTLRRAPKGGGGRRVPVWYGLALSRGWGLGVGGLQVGVRRRCGRGGGVATTAAGDQKTAAMHGSCSSGSSPDPRTSSSVHATSAALRVRTIGGTRVLSVVRAQWTIVTPSPRNSVE